MITVLQCDEDLRWLQDVYGIPTKGVEVAIIYGNEDAPDRVQTYLINDYQTEPRTYTNTASGYRLM